MSACSQKTPQYDSVHFKDGRFFNLHVKETKRSFFRTLKIFWKLNTDITEGRIPKESEIPVVFSKKQDLLDMPDNSVLRINHSTLLFKLDNRFVLTDPMFSNRASPLSFVGPKRFHPPAIDINELPIIDIMILSHNHYDHFDEESLEYLKDKILHVYTTLGLKNQLVKRGFDPNKVSEFDWWEEAEDGSITITATPAQHFSARGLFDRNKTFWASWVIRSSKANIYFGADSGYSVDFKTIGERFGPFDMTFIEAGAYNEMWKTNHLMPHESVQAHIDLKGKIMFPIHNGTFPLSTHPWREPFELTTKYAKERNVLITHPKMGQVIPLLHFEQTTKWWE